MHAHVSAEYTLQKRNIAVNIKRGVCKGNVSANRIDEGMIGLDVILDPSDIDQVQRMRVCTSAAYHSGDNSRFIYTTVYRCQLISIIEFSLDVKCNR